MTASTRSFSPLQRTLHWVMAAAVLAMLFIGVGMVSTTTPKYVPLVAIHKTLGVVILLLAIVRLAVRLRLGAPALPADLPRPMRLAAHLSHYALYGMIFAMPLLGWAMMSAAAYPIVLAGDIRLPPILPQSDTMHALLWTAHATLAFLFFGLILMHLSAALFHGLVRHDGVLGSMLPLPSLPRRPRAPAGGGPS